MTWCPTCCLVLRDFVAAVKHGQLEGRDLRPRRLVHARVRQRPIVHLRQQLGQGGALEGERLAASGGRESVRAAVGTELRVAECEQSERPCV